MKDTLIIGTKRMKCPQCGWTCGISEGVMVSFSEYAGHYCMQCWAKWIASTLPKMIEVEEHNDSSEKCS